MARDQKGDQKGKTRPSVPRTRKVKQPLVVEPACEINPELQKQGMSSVWQQFYAKVKQATQTT